MLSILIIWTYILFISTVSGYSFFQLFTLVIKRKKETIPPLYLLVLAGQLFLIPILGYCSILSKIGMVVNVGIFLIVTFLFFWKFSDYKTIIRNSLVSLKALFIPAKVILLLWFLLFLLLAIHPASNFDTGLYHLQAIKWITQFPAIPGLGNLHGRFAFNNHSFLTEAFFSFSFLKIRIFSACNSFIYFYFASTSTFLYFRNLKQNFLRIPLTTYLFPLYFGILLFGQWVSSPTPDIPILGFIWITFIILIDDIFNPKHEHGNDFKYNLIVLTIITCFTIKISIIFLFPFLPLLLFLKKNLLKKRNTYFLVLTSIFIVIPFFLRNIILSGYLLFPVAAIDIFNFDWKIPIEVVKVMKNTITGWAQSSSVVPKPLNEWVIPWVSKLTGDFAYYFWACMLLPIWLIFIGVVKHQIIKRNYPILTISLVAWINLLFWFYNAPDLRFAWVFFGLILSSIYHFATILIVEYSFETFISFGIEKWINKKTLKSTLYVASNLFLLGWFLNFSFQKLRTTYQSTNIIQNSIFPPKYPIPKTNLLTTQNGFKYSVSTEGEGCWHAPLLCTVTYSIGLNPNIAYRGGQIKSGFKILASE